MGTADGRDADRRRDDDRVRSADEHLIRERAELTDEVMASTRQIEPVDPTEVDEVEGT